MLVVGEREGGGGWEVPRKNERSTFVEYLCNTLRLTKKLGTIVVCFLGAVCLGVSVCVSHLDLVKLYYRSKAERGKRHAQQRGISFRIADGGQTSRTVVRGTDIGIGAGGSP